MTERRDDAVVVVVTVTVTQHATGDFLARVDFNGERGRIGCRATAPVASFNGAAEVASEVLRGLFPVRKQGAGR